MERETIVAVKGIILWGGEILIIRRCRNDRHAPGAWEFAGGRIEFGEAPEHALRREIAEETGLSATIERILYAADFRRTPNQHVVVLTYLCGVSADSHDVNLSEEHEDFLWVTSPQLSAYLYPPIYEDLLHYDVLKYLEK